MAKRAFLIAAILFNTTLFSQQPRSQSSAGYDTGPKQTSPVTPSDGNDRTLRGKSNKQYKACPPPFNPSSCIEEKTGNVRLHPRPF